MPDDIIDTAWQLSGSDRLHNTLLTLAGDWDKYDEKAKRALTRSAALAGLGATAAVGIVAIGKAALESAGNMQKIESGFATMLGGADAAKNKVAELQQFAAKTPFDFTQSAEAAQQMLAMGFSGEQLVPVMTSVGNAVSAAGKGTEDFTRVLRILGKIKTTGVLQGDELNQLAEAGIPAAKILQQELGLTAEQMQNIGSMKLPADTVIAALTKGFDKKFGGAMERQLETIPGQLSNVGDAFEQLKTSVGQTFAPEAVEALKSLANALNWANQFAKDHPTLVKFGLAIAGTGALAVTAGASYNFARNALGGLATAAKDVTAAKKALGGAVAAEAAEEVAKTGIANTEAKALKGTASAAENAAGKMGILGRAKGLLDRQVFSGSIGNVGATVSAGELAGGALGGLAAYSTVKGAGASDAQAIGTGVGVGVVAALGGPWTIGAALIASGVGSAVNHFYSDKLEKAAVEGNGLDQKTVDEISGPNKNAQKAAAFKQKYLEAREAGDDDEARMWLQNFTIEDRIAKKAEKKQKAVEDDAAGRAHNAETGRYYRDWASSHGGMLSEEQASGRVDNNGMRNVGRGRREVRLTVNLPPSQTERDSAENLDDLYTMVH